QMAILRNKNLEGERMILALVGFGKFRRQSCHLAETLRPGHKRVAKRDGHINLVGQFLMKAAHEAGAKHSRRCISISQVYAGKLPTGRRTSKEPDFNICRRVIQIFDSAVEELIW